MFLRGTAWESLCYCHGFEFWHCFKLRGWCRTRPPRGGPAVRSPRGAVTSTCGVKKEKNFPSSTCIEFLYSNLRPFLAFSIFQAYGFKSRYEKFFQWTFRRMIENFQFFTAALKTTLGRILKKKSTAKSWFNRLFGAERGEATTYSSPIDIYSLARLVLGMKIN